VSVPEAHAPVDQEPPVTADLEHASAALPQPIVDEVAPPPAIEREEHVSVPEPSPPSAQEPPLKADREHTSAALPQPIVDEVAPPPAVKRKRKRVSVRRPKPSVAQEPPGPDLEHTSAALPQPIADRVAPPSPIQREEHVSVPEPSPPLAQEPPLKADQALDSEAPAPLDEVQTPPSEAPMISDAEAAVPISSQVQQNIAEIAPVLHDAPDAQSAAEELANIETAAVVESEDEASHIISSADDIPMPVLEPPTPTAASLLPSAEQSAAMWPSETVSPSGAIASTTVGEPSPSWWRELPRWWREIPRWSREMPRWLWPSAGAAAAVLISVLFLFWPRSHRVEQPISSHNELSAPARTRGSTDEGSRSQLGPTAAPASVVQGSATPQAESLAGTSAQSPSPGPTESSPASASNELPTSAAPVEGPPVVSEMSPPPAGPSGDMTTERALPAAPLPAPSSVDKHVSAAADTSSPTTKAESNSKAPQKLGKRASHKTQAAQTPAAKMPAASIAPSPARAKASVRKTPPPQPFEGVPGN
jgi:hypothetical protein